MLSTVFKRWSMQTVLHCLQAWKRWTGLCVGSRRLARRARHSHARSVLAAWRQLSSKRGKREGAAPTITTQPASASVPLGGRTSLRLVAVSPSPMTFQWMRDGVALPGATSAALDIVSVASDAVGAYTCTVANASGSVVSVPAALSLMAPPVILAEPESRIVAHGQVVDFVVEATGASEYVPCRMACVRPVAWRVCPSPGVALPAPPPPTPAFTQFAPPPSAPCSLQVPVAARRRGAAWCLGLQAVPGCVQGHVRSAVRVCRLQRCWDHVQR
jgi:hypothetical protein